MLCVPARNAILFGSQWDCDPMVRMHSRNTLHPRASSGTILFMSPSHHSREITMFRTFLSAALTLCFVGTCHAQTNKFELISSSKNINCQDMSLFGKEVTPECDTPWSVNIKTLHGGKQEGVRLITLD